MDSKFTIKKKLFAFVLALSFVVPAAYSPALAPQAQAFLGIGDLTVLVGNIPDYIKDILRVVGKTMAKKMIDDMVQSTIRWANTGFNGNPAYPTDWGRDLENIAKGAAGDYIAGTKLDFLCEPFSAQIKLSLVDNYTPRETRFNCTLDDIGANIDQFYQGQFKEGGWDAWLKVSQTSTNNPFGAYVTIKGDLDKELQEKLGLENNERFINKGFLSYRDCLQRNEWPPLSKRTDWELGDAATKQRIRSEFPNWRPGVMEGECIEQSAVKTPGGVIESKLNQALGSGLEGLITADSIDSLVSAFANGLLQRYVFGDTGLFSDSSTAARRTELLDIDNDKIPDGYDTDGDQVLNICHNGLKDISRPASNQNCIGSKEAVSSPYFSKICETLTNTKSGLEVFQRFLDANQKWDPNMARTWQNRVIDGQTVVEDFITQVSRYEAPAFNQIIGNFGQYANHLGVMIKSLVKDGDLRGDGLSPAFFGPGKADEITIANTTQANRDRIAYLNRFNASLGKCDDPDIDAIRNIGLPPPVSSTTPTTTTTQNYGLSCSASRSSATTNQPVVWSTTGTVDDATGYQWFGEEINEERTSAPSNITVFYSEVGTKTAYVVASFATSSPVTINCEAPVEVQQGDFQ